MSCPFCFRDKARSNRHRPSPCCATCPGYAKDLPRAATFSEWDLEREIETAMSTGGTSVFLQHCGTFLWVSLAAVREAGLRNCDTVRLAGHSLGQFAAYAASGAIDRDAAIALVAQRGRVLEDACREHPG